MTDICVGATFILPMPISVNGAYANGGNKRGRHKTARANTWIAEAGRALARQHVPTLTPPYHVTYSFGRPDKRRRDAFNYEKLLSDFLVAQDVLTDDCEIERGTVEWSTDVEPGMVKVEVRTA